MNQQLRSHADRIVREAIAAVQPDAAVQRALSGMEFPGRVLLVAAGKAAWQMAKAASGCLGDRIENGVVVTKYGHVMGPIANFTCFEAGHPVPDENSFRGTQAALDLVADLTEKDTVLFLLSGGGSALFEKPLVPAEELQDITGQLLACGADIVEINTIRKRLSQVKGGRFAQLCWPGKVEAVVLSDILGDPLDMIASGPACPDSATAEDAQRLQLYSGKCTVFTSQPETLEAVLPLLQGLRREAHLIAPLQEGGLHQQVRHPVFFHPRQGFLQGVPRLLPQLFQLPQDHAVSSFVCFYIGQGFT